MSGNRLLPLLFVAIALFLLLRTTHAFSQTCPGLDPGWSQWYGTGQVQMAGWNQQTQSMVITYRQSPPNNRVFANVPQSITQRMSSLTDATQFVAQNIVPVYHEALLTSLQNSPSMCPILTQANAWILTH